MNKRQLSSFALGLLLFAASCKKNDVQMQSAAKAETTTTAAAKTDASATAWATVSQWNSNKQEGFTTFSTELKDSSITSAVIAKGLVLVFMNSSTGIVSLPFQQKTGGDAFWYYQLSKNTLKINVDAYTGTNPGTNGVKYFVVTPERLQELQQSGHTKKELLTLSYESAAALLK